MGTTWSPIGETPGLPEYRGESGYNAITFVSAGGKIYFHTVTGKMDRFGFIEFLKMLQRDVGKPIILIVDRASYHTAKDVKVYVESTDGSVTPGVLHS